MKILVIGGGVLGSLYAARLQQVGNEVTVLARGERLDEIRQYGLVLENFNTRERTVTRVNVVDALAEDAAYDWAMVLVRNEQVESVLPLLQKNHSIPNLLFMYNNPFGSQGVGAAVGEERVVLGFPGAAGEKSGEVVRYLITPSCIQVTTIGEPSGEISQRVGEFAAVLSAAGFQVAISRDMDAWLKTHVALVLPLACGVYLAGGNTGRLARTRDGLILVIRGIRDALNVLRLLGIPIQPGRMQLMLWIPEPILLLLFQAGLSTRMADFMISRHANRARTEMKALFTEFNHLVLESEAYTPALDRLSVHMNPHYPTMPPGRKWIPIAWKGLWAWLVGLMAFWAFVRYIRRTRN